MKTALLVAAVISVAGFSAWQWRGHHAAASHDSEKLVTDRLWIDHIPKNERDVIQVFAAITDESFGVFQATSAWRGQFEGFRFEAHGDELRVVYPQTGDKETIKARAKRCDVKGMDFCLEIDGASRGVKKYFSREGWEIGNAHNAAELEQRVEALEQKLGTSE